MRQGRTERPAAAGDGKRLTQPDLGFPFGNLQVTEFAITSATRLLLGRRRHNTFPPNPAASRAP
jgi:hypothetical protein